MDEAQLAFAPQLEAPEGELARFDPWRGQVLAAMAVGDGRWVVSEAEPDEQLGLWLALVLGIVLLASVPALLNGVN